MFNIRDLTSEELQAAWTGALKKGDTFKFKGKTWECLSNTLKSFRIRSETGETITFKKYNGVFATEGKQANFFRDVEGVLMVDLINENNKLHEFSDFYHLTLKVL